MGLRFTIQSRAREVILGCHDNRHVRLQMKQAIRVGEMLKVHHFQIPRNLPLTSTEHHHRTAHKLKSRASQWWRDVEVSRQTDGVQKACKPFRRLSL